MDVPTVRRVRRIPAPEGGTGSSFADEVREAGMNPSTDLVRAEAVVAPVGIARLLEIESDAPVLVRERHMYADDRPVQLATSYIPLSLAGSVELAFPDTGPTGIYRRLAERGHRVARFAEEIEGRRPLPEELDFLRVGRGGFVLEVRRLAYGEEGKPVEVTINVFPGQLWRLRYEWAAEGAG
ncbi:GntR family transcriptional regulator [Actinomadura fibrosa]|uniref:GntR family transcriptional regulator n=1 Tax=Actinomadura fibrosa TaxID=111802 RepID=A0ABW2XZ04_9ACTN|nr:UTRA domain-containing protein [Actinomadura fibrosa]